MCVWVLVSVYVCVVCAGVRAAAGAAATPRTMQHMRQFSSNRSHVRIVGPTWFGVVGFGLVSSSCLVSSVDFVVLIKYVHALRDPSSNADKNIIKNCCTRMLRRITELIIFATRKSYLAFYARCVTVWLLSALKSSAPLLVPFFLFSLPFSSHYLFPSVSLNAFSCLMAEQFA